MNKVWWCGAGGDACSKVMVSEVAAGACRLEQWLVQQPGCFLFRFQGEAQQVECVRSHVGCKYSSLSVCGAKLDVVLREYGVSVVCILYVRGVQLQWALCRDTGEASCGGRCEGQRRLQRGTAVFGEGVPCAHVLLVCEGMSSRVLFAQLASTAVEAVEHGFAQCESLVKERRDKALTSIERIAFRKAEVSGLLAKLSQYEDIWTERTNKVS
jgi:hypothetical protein